MITIAGEFINGLPIDSDNFGNLLLKEFTELSVPTNISVLPATIGWKIMALIGGIYLAYRLYRYFHMWLKNQYRRGAIRQIIALTAAEQGDKQWLQSVSKILKSTSLQAYPRQIVAVLTGAAWVSFLNRQTVKPCFTGQSILLLGGGQYQPQVEICKEGKALLAQQAILWIATHHGVVVTLENGVLDD